MDESDTKCGCGGNIIVRDESLVASDYIEWPLPGCRSCVSITLSLSAATDLLGCIGSTKESKLQREESIIYSCCVRTGRIL